MTDWLINGEPGQVFVTSPDGVLTYGELASAAPARRTDGVSVLVPERTVAGVKEIFAAIMGGPLVLSSGTGWFGYTVPGDVMTVLATSGTTGRPKLVPLTAANWEAAVSASAAHLDHRPDDQWLIAMPLHRVGGLAVLLRSAHVGARVRLLPEFDAGAFADELGMGTTIASVVPTMLRRVLDFDERSYSGLRAVLVGGGPIPGGLLEEAMDRGLPVLPTYGMTETCAQVATLRPGTTPRHEAHLLPGIEARIEPDGRIALRGEQVFSGYLGEPRRPPGEWFVTGDLGSLHGDALQIIGRADAVIVTGGMNVDPAAVEAVVRAAAGVDDAAVVGVPSPEWGFEVVCIYAGTSSADELARLARARLERFEVPKRWVRAERVPRDDWGKVDREAALALVGRPSS